MLEVDNRKHNASGVDTVEKKENREIILLDGKRSLNVNIFLKQFRSSIDDIIRLIKVGAHDDIGAEKLRGLLKILPEVNELDMLKQFDGDKSRLGNAERFLLQLLQTSNWEHVFEEFSTNVGYLDPCITALNYAAKGELLFFSRIFVKCPLPFFQILSATSIFRRSFTWLWLQTTFWIL